MRLGQLLASPCMWTPALSDVNIVKGRPIFSLQKVMIHQSAHREVIEAYVQTAEHCGTVLRNVCSSDAEFILSLRTNGALNKHISATPGGVAEQRKWIERYLERFDKGEEAYFIAEHSGVPRGTIRIYEYDVNAGTFVYGSWLMSTDAPACCAFSTTILSHDLGFKALGFSKVLFDVRKDNKSVCAFHEAVGATLLRQDDINRYYEITSEAYPALRRKMGKFALRFHERPRP